MRGGRATGSLGQGKEGRPDSSGGDRPLAGMRVLVTRAEDQGEGLLHALGTLGASVVWIPSIRTEPIRPTPAEIASLDHLNTFRWTAFTSPNAVRYFLALLSERGAVFPREIRVAAVGAATGRALEEAGIPVHSVPGEATGKALARHLTAISPPSRLLLPRGRKGREELPEILGAAGWEVVPLTCYDTLPAVVSPEAAAELARGLDAALFASPSAARNLWAALGEPGREVLRRALLVPIGPTTALALKEIGLEPTLPPADYSVPGLVDALRKALGPAGKIPHKGVDDG